MTTAVEVGICLLAQVHALVFCQKERWQLSTILLGDAVTNVKRAWRKSPERLGKYTPVITSKAATLT